MRPSSLCSNKPSDGSQGSAAWEKWRTPSSEAQWKGLGRGTSVCQSQGLDCFCGMTVLRGQGVGKLQPIQQIYSTASFGRTHHLRMPLLVSVVETGFPGGARGAEPSSQCLRHGFDPWVGKIPWRRRRQPAPVFLPGEPHGWRSLVGYSPWE